MSDALNYPRASKIRRFGPLASTSGNRTSWRGSISAPMSQDEPRSPLLPNDVQRSLLHVGMRVRKSVPAGYKTSAEDFSRALRERITGIHESTEKSKSTLSTTAKKRTLDQDNSHSATPTWQPNMTVQTVLQFGSSARQFGTSKVRSFAIPKSRKAKPWPEPMDVDTQMFVNENGDFKEAEFLQYERS